MLLKPGGLYSRVRNRWVVTVHPAWEQPNSKWLFHGSVLHDLVYLPTLLLDQKYLNFRGIVLFKQAVSLQLLVDYSV